MARMRRQHLFCAILWFTFSVSASTQKSWCVQRRESDRREDSGSTRLGLRRKCERRNIELCHKALVTHFEPHEEEICGEDFVKTCRITFAKRAVNNTVRVCETPFREECGPSPEDNDDDDDRDVKDRTVCKSYFQTKCSTVLRGSPRLAEAGCWKERKRICAPERCKVVEAGERECRESVVGVLEDAPAERCRLRPIKACRRVTRLLPRLKAQNVCREVPRTVCAEESRAYLAPPAWPKQKRDDKLEWPGKKKMRWCDEEEAEEEWRNGKVNNSLRDIIGRGKAKKLPRRVDEENRFRVDLLGFPPHPVWPPRLDTLGGGHGGGGHGGGGHMRF